MTKNLRISSKMAPHCQDHTIKGKVSNFKCGPGTAGDKLEYLISYFLFLGHTPLTSDQKLTDIPKILSKTVAQDQENMIAVKVTNYKRGPDTLGDMFKSFLAFKALKHFLHDLCK